MQHLDVVGGDAQGVGHDLGEGRVVALAVGEVPLITVTLPVGLQRTEARSQPPPAYWSVPSTCDGAQPQTSM